VRRLRFGAVPYLNIEPFLSALRDTVSCEVIRCPPSRLRTLWRSARLDASLLSVTDVFDEGLRPLAGASISAAGPVQSVLLTGRGAAATWERVALDAASRTSNELARLVLALLSDRAPELSVAEDPPAAVESGLADAAVVIGDRALQSARAEVTLDLAEVWNDITGLPFVFAVWVRGRGSRVPVEVLEAILAEAGSRSAGYVPAAARRHAARLGLDDGMLREYLGRSISYRFGPAEAAGLQRFREMALSVIGPRPCIAEVSR
jgi:predicted solute-binding protein